MSEATAPTGKTHDLQSCACGEMPEGAVAFAQDPLRVRCEFRCKCGESAVDERRLPVNCHARKMAERQARMVTARAMATWNLKMRGRNSEQLVNVVESASVED